MPISDRARERISRPSDARVTKSREALKAALLALIDLKPLEQITIKEIATHASVSYPVFFRQFATKEDLLADIAAEQVRHLLGQSLPAFVQDENNALLEMCDYVQNHRKLWSTLLTAGANSEMRREFSRIAGELGEEHDPVNPGLPTELVTEMVTNSIFDILSWWLRQDDDYPVANVIKILDTFVVQTYTKPLGMGLI